MISRTYSSSNARIAKLLPNPAKIAGRILATSVVIAKMEWTEFLGDLSGRLAMEQRQLIQYQRVPPEFATYVNSEDCKILELATPRSYNF